MAMPTNVTTKMSPDEGKNENAEQTKRSTADGCEGDDEDEYADEDAG